MFKYRKLELSVYIIIITLSVLFSVLLLAFGYKAWFLFAVAAYLIPCAYLLVKIFIYNSLFSTIERYIKNGEYDELDHYAEKKKKKFDFVKIYQINSYLEKGDIEKYISGYNAFSEKRRLLKRWQFRLEAHKVFYDLLSGGEVSVRNATRLESDIDAEEVEQERSVCKTLDYFFKGDYERAEKQLGWLTKESESKFVRFVTLYVRYMTKAVFGEGEELKEKLSAEGYNDFLKRSIDYLERRVTEICERSKKEDI